jgi:hypothetical protein
MSAPRTSAPNSVLTGMSDPTVHSFLQCRYPTTFLPGKSRKTNDLQSRITGSLVSEALLWRLLIASAIGPAFWAKKRSNEGELSDRSRQLGGF